MVCHNDTDIPLTRDESSSKIFCHVRIHIFKYTFSDSLVYHNSSGTDIMVGILVRINIFMFCKLFSTF